MGIGGLNKFLREMCPHVFQTVELKDFAFKKCAIDTSMYIYKYMAIFGPEEWMSAFISLVVCLKENRIHPCFIFDNGCPEEKLIERARRKEGRGKIDDKVEKLENEILEYYATGNFSDFLQIMYTKKCLEKDEQPKRLLSTRKVPDEDKIKKLEEELERLRNQSITVTEDDILKIKEFLRLVKVPYFDAELEAETTCVDLCKRGKVDFVISEDSDVFAYGCPLTVKDINTSDGKCLVIVYDDIISGLEMTDKTFLDFCIMCGCDYNINIPLIGCKKAFLFMKEHKDIDALIQSGTCKKDHSVLNHVRVRQLFTEYAKTKYDVPYSGIVDYFEPISFFLFTKNIKYDIEKLERVFRLKSVAITGHNSIV